MPKEQETRSPEAKGQTPEAKLMAALVKALPGLDAPKKTSNNPHYRSKYADLASVIEAIRPIADHGIWFRQVTLECDNGAMVETFYLGHGTEISAGVIHIPADKRNAHGFGSALTYARRYGLQTAFGLAPEDDDGNAAVESQPKDGGSKITDEQFAEINRQLDELEADKAAFCELLGVASVKDIPAARYNHAIDLIGRKRAAMRAQKAKQVGGEK